MPNGTAVGWKNGVVTDVRDMKLADGRRFIKFLVNITDGGATLRASGICRPTIVPGGDLYKWIRICKVPLAEIDSMVKRDSFVGKPVRVNIVQKGEFFNIIDCKEVGG